MKEPGGKNKKQKAPVSKPRIFKPNMTAAALLLLAGFLAAAFFDAWCGVQSRRMGYEIVQEKMQQERLLEYNKKLKIEKARLSSPQALRRYAGSELELETPKPEQIILMP